MIYNLFTFCYEHDINIIVPSLELDYERFIENFYQNINNEIKDTNNEI